MKSVTPNPLYLSHNSWKNSIKRQSESYNAGGYSPAAFDKVSQESLLEARERMTELTNCLKQHSCQHNYIEKIAKFSPNYRELKRMSVPRMPGSNRVSPPVLQRENKRLMELTTKNWLKKKVQFDRFKEPNNKRADSSIQVKKQYLMSEQEIKQDEIIEAIFKKFDTDGSGLLDLQECVDLFSQNLVRLDPEVVKKLLGGEEFTLQKFKAIINSPKDLQRFKDVFKTQRYRIMRELEGRFKLQREIKKNMYVKHNSKFRGNYIPQTFEAVMESFGIKLQRKQFYEEFLHSNNQLEPSKLKNTTDKDLMEKVQKTGQKMIDLLQISSAEPCSLKNEHNQLFLSLMENLKYQNSLNRIADKFKLNFENKVKHYHEDVCYDNTDSEDDYFPQNVHSQVNNFLQETKTNAKKSVRQDMEQLELSMARSNAGSKMSYPESPYVSQFDSEQLSRRTFFKRPVTYQSQRIQKGQFIKSGQIQLEQAMHDYKQQTRQMKKQIINDTQKSIGSKSSTMKNIEILNIIQNHREDLDLEPMPRPQRIIFDEKIQESKLVQRNLNNYIRTGVAVSMPPKKEFRYMPENGKLGQNAKKFWPKSKI